MTQKHWFIVFWFLLVSPTHFVVSQSTKKPNLQLIDRVTDAKDFKKLLRTKTNILVLFSSVQETSSSVKSIVSVCAGAAEKVYGRATLAFVNCGDTEGKKLCKKFKIVPQPYLLKHYHNGEFHLDYNRLLTIESMTRFLLDPKGDIPWEEDNTSGDVAHIKDPQAFKRMLKKEPLPLLIMFYAPWCAHCKRLKPEYAQAATELKGQAVLAAMDLARSENTDIQAQFDIKGFPTLIYFEHGKLKFHYGGANNKDGLIKWMKDPTPPKEEKPAEEKPWSEEVNDVVHLTEATFNETIAGNPSVLVMFYAPWCGHCKAMKPDYAEAATQLKQQTPDTAVFAAVDATLAENLAKRFEVKGFPTLKYFKNGEFAFDYGLERTKAKLIEFMLDPKQPPPPPPPEKPWSEVASDVIHLNEENFKTELKRKKHALVMFYAPWCGHCKSAKPEFTQAADVFKDDPKIGFCAVDCVAHESLCNQYNVSSFPTIYYFSYLKTSKQYMSGRRGHDFVSYITQQIGLTEKPKEEVPPPEEDEEVEYEFGEAVWQLRPDSFDNSLKSTSVALVMFYAPWCPHCKKAILPYSEAAAIVESAHGKLLSSFDCTQDVAFCTERAIKGYPTYHLYEGGKYHSVYKGPRTKEAFVSAVGVGLPKTEL